MKSNQSTKGFVENGKRMRKLSGRTTEDAYPKMFPVNSIHASAPRFNPGLVKEGLSERCSTYVIRWRNLALIDRYNRPGCQHYSSGARVRRHMIDTHDSSPTPNPEINLPTTMLGMPPVKVWIAPPRVKTTAPVNRVPLRPIASPMRPAASEVTVEHQSGMSGLGRASEFSRAY